MFENKDYELYLGDCLEVIKNIPDKSIDMILCDLPYGTTQCKWDVIIPFDELWKQYKRIIKDRGVIALFGSEPFSSMLRMSNIKNYKYDWIWDKGRGTDFLNAKRKPLACYEIISIFYKKAPQYNPQYWYSNPYNKGMAKNSKNTNNCYGNTGDIINKSDDGKRYPLNILRFNKVNMNKLYHPTQKPVELLEYLIKTYTNENEIVLDNCMGSGSTGVAAINLNRKFIGIELDEKYFEIAKERIEKSVNKED